MMERFSEVIELIKSCNSKDLPKYLKELRALMKDRTKKRAENWERKLAKIDAEVVRYQTQIGILLEAIRELEQETAGGNQGKITKILQQAANFQGNIEGLQAAKEIILRG